MDRCDLFSATQTHPARFLDPAEAMRDPGIKRRTR